MGHLTKMKSSNSYSPLQFCFTHIANPFTKNQNILQICVVVKIGVNSPQMDKIKHYKFINSETGNVIYFLSLPESCPATENELEKTRFKVAAENRTYVGNIYYVLYDEDIIE